MSSLITTTTSSSQRINDMAYSLSGSKRSRDSSAIGQALSTVSSYGGGGDSFDDDLETESRPSKRSRTSSDSSLSLDEARVCPWAPVKASNTGEDSVSPWDNEEEDDTVTRNLAEEMAEAVLKDEPKDTHSNVFWSSQSSNSSSNIGWASNTRFPDEVQPYREPKREEFDITLSFKGKSFHLDLSHPLVMLSFLRFVREHNFFSHFGNEIDNLQIPRHIANDLLQKPSAKRLNLRTDDGFGELERLLERYGNPSQ